MKSTNPRIERLKEMMNLEEKRVALQEELDTIISRMTELNGSLLTEDEPSTPAPSAPRASKAPSSKPAQANGRHGRGGLKDRIMAALESAGSSGVHVKELALSLGTKPVNVHSWFHSAIKRRQPGIKKITGGHYRLEGRSEGNRTEEAKSSKGTSSKGRTKSSGRKKSTAPQSKRGELSSRILSALEGAGSSGITVRDIADQLGANYKNIYIWFATTGKKNSNIRKMGPGHYRLTA